VLNLSSLGKLDIRIELEYLLGEMDPQEDSAVRATQLDGLWGLVDKLLLL
jgi:hypothetical protein